MRVIPDNLNGLDKESAADVLQLRGVDTQRFIRFIGRIAPAAMEEIVAAIAPVVEYQ